MLGPRQAKKFINDNRDALAELGRLISECKDITNPEYQTLDNNARLAAIKLVEKWIYRVFEISNTDEALKTEEDNIYVRLTSTQVDEED